MVESAVYYRAFHPVLDTLQALKPEQMSFKKELIEATEGPLPPFLNRESTFDASIVYKNREKGERMTLQQFFSTPNTANSIFDASQERAMKIILRKRIGIIQGPPGCGKSFIGISLFILFQWAKPPKKQSEGVRFLLVRHSKFAQFLCFFRLD